MSYSNWRCSCTRIFLFKKGQTQFFQISKHLQLCKASAGVLSLKHLSKTGAWTSTFCSSFSTSPSYFSTPANDIPLKSNLLFRICWDCIIGWKVTVVYKRTRKEKGVVIAIISLEKAKRKQKKGHSWTMKTTKALDWKRRTHTSTNTWAVPLAPVHSRLQNQDVAQWEEVNSSSYREGQLQLSCLCLLSFFP